MKSSNPVPSWDEIVFEKRNKLYGAYVLRKSYKSVVIRSMGLTLGSFLVLIFLMKFFQNVPVSIVPDKVTGTIVIDVNPIEPVTEKPSTPSSPQKPSGPVDEHAFIPVDTLSNDPVDTASSATPSDNSGSANTDTASGSESGIPSGLPIESINDTFSMSSVDIIPEFPGGFDKFTLYLLSHIKYTAEAREAGLVKKIRVRFTINKEGFVSDVRLMEKVGYGMDERITKVLMSSNKWNPGVLRDKPVNTDMILPISFSIY